MVRLEEEVEKIQKIEGRMWRGEEDGGDLLRIDFDRQLVLVFFYHMI